MLYYIYTCAATRGIVLDLVPGARTQTFYLGFKRFISQSGFLRVLLSGNGSPFITNSMQEFVIEVATSSAK